LQEGFAIWIIGLPASGKSTLARALAQELNSRGIKIQILESDELRKVLVPHSRYSEEERNTFYRSLVFIGELLTKNGVNVLFDATGNKEKYRAWAREKIGRFMLIYLKCPLEVCIQRDPKGIYQKGLRGDFTTVPGLQAKFEEPLEPDLVIESDKVDSKVAVQKILEAMRAQSKV